MTRTQATAQGSGGGVLVVATSNAGKKREIQQVLGPLGLRLLSLDELGLAAPEPEEDADTFMDNACKKALYYSRLAGTLTLADDSGLEVDVLGGLPGVHSARFAGPQRDSLANNARLIGLLAGIPVVRRTARFRCALAAADPQGITATAEGTIEGLIIDEPRGGGGFGYDPHFFVPALACTTAELSSTEKNRVSHRGQALRRIAQLLAAAPSCGPVERRGGAGK